MNGKQDHITTIRIEDSDFRILQDMAVNLDRSISSIIRKAVKTYIKVYLTRKENENNEQNKND